MELLHLIAQNGIKQKDINGYVLNIDRDIMNYFTTITISTSDFIYDLLNIESDIDIININTDEEVFKAEDIISIKVESSKTPTCICSIDGTSYNYKPISRTTVIIECYKLSKRERIYYLRKRQV